jgi:hypothetical protein
VLSEGGKPWNGLLIEIQYRTYPQHAWATAVEVAGLLTHNNPKFGQGSPELIEFFSIASELIARCYESMTAGMPNEKGGDLKARLNYLERETRNFNSFVGLTRRWSRSIFERTTFLFSHSCILLKRTLATFRY